MSYRWARRPGGGVASLLSLILLCNGAALAQTPASGGGTMTAARQAGTRKAPAAQANAAEAAQFVTHAEQRLAELGIKVSRASW
ncbi:MAG TPA: hypothetical protein VGB61_14770, partial [Pyrinomonadaceae bacterium]